MNVVAWPVKYYPSTKFKTMPGVPPPSEEERALELAPFERMAIEFLWEWTNRQFGLHTVEFAPCRIPCPSPAPTTYWGRGPYTSSYRWQPVLIGGAWYNLSCGACGLSECGCLDAGLRLPGPMHDIVSVTLDGQVLDSSEYRLRGNVLERLGGQGWPISSNCDERFVVRYVIGREVPEPGQYAAGHFALELEKAARGDKSCALPQRLQSITRQGVTMDILDDFEDVKEGRTGIWLIDAWITSVTRTNNRSAVYLPHDRPSAARGRFL